MDLTPAPSRYDPIQLGKSAVPWETNNGNITADAITTSALGDQTVSVSSGSGNDSPVRGPLMIEREARVYVSTMSLSC